MNHDSDPPTQDDLYDLTHNLTDEFIELNQHSRDCDCPFCNGDYYPENDDMYLDDNL